jgi:hypothetical protein
MKIINKFERPTYPKFCEIEIGSVFRWADGSPCGLLHTGGHNYLIKVSHDQAYNITNPILHVKCDLAQPNYRNLPVVVYDAELHISVSAPKSEAVT